MYNVNLKNIIPSRDLTCLFAKATLDESKLWHRRLGHINFKTMNKLVKGNLVRGLPSKVFENNNICVACKKGKQHRASCKTKPVSSVNQPLYRLHMDLFGPTFVKSLNKKSYCLFVTDDYSRFTWVFFLATKDETSPILKTFITGLENQLSLKVKVIRSDNGTEFKNNDLNKFYGMKGIKREFSVPRTPQQNGIAERKNRTLIEAARTMLADLLLPIPFWAATFGSTNPHNTDGDAAFDEKEPEFEGSKLESEVNVSPSRYRNLSAKFEYFSDNNINEDNAAGTLVPAVGQNFPNSTNTFSAAGPSNAAASPTHGKSSCIDTSQLPDDPNMPELKDITYSDDEDDVGADVDFNNLETSITVSPIPTTRVHKDHPVTQIIGDLSSATQTRIMTRVAKDQGGLSQINNDDFHTFDLPHGKRVIGTKWVFRNKKDERGVGVRNKARLVGQGHTQEEGIDYEEVFAPAARIEAIRLFLAYASFMGFMVYQMDINSAFLYGTIEEEVYVYQPPGFEDPDYHDNVYKVVKALYGLHQAPRACQDKYVAEILRKFRLTDGKSASTPIDTEKPLLKDPDGEDVVQSGMESLKRVLHVTNILSAGSLTSQQMVLNSPCLTHIKNWLVQIKWSLIWLVQKQTTLGVNTPRCDDDRIELMELTVFLLPSDEKGGVKVNDVTRLQALVDKKKVVITEASIRDSLRLDDVEGIECLPNEEIFAELARMRYEKPSTKLTFYKAFFSSQWKFLIHTILQCMSAKRTSWNEFSSSVASAVICLSTGRKFNFSKYIFYSLVRNVDSPTKFYMYPRFLQLMIRKQVGDLSTHTTKYTSPDLTQKVAEGDDDEVHVEDVNAAGVATEGVVGAADDIVPTVDNEPSIPSPTPPTPPLQTSQD
nr:putative ribonuclease H-like domain-containing protein [Tanacetum cinerariifolium]